MVETFGLLSNVFVVRHSPSLSLEETRISEHNGHVRCDQKPREVLFSLLNFAAHVLVNRICVRKAGTVLLLKS